DAQVVNLSPGALEVYTQFCNRIAHELDNPDFPDELKPAWIKFRTHVLRLALVVHLLQWVGDTSPGGSGLREGVGAATVEAAVQLAGYFMATARRVACVATDDDATQRARAVLHWLVRPREQCITRFKAWEFLKQRHGSLFRGLKDLNPALSLLVRHHYLRV